MTTDPHPDTRERLLDAAEALFAEHGISATSLRAITGAAAANLASIHYYFGSREELIRAVFARRIDPLNAERMRRLDRVEARARAAGTRPCLEDLVEAMVGPILRLKAEDPEIQHRFFRLFTQVHAESEEVRRMILSRFAGVIERALPLFREALPSIPELDLLWRFKLMMGAVAMSFHPLPGLGPFEALGREPADADLVLRRILPFLAGGLRAAPADDAAEGEAPGTETAGGSDG
jgi:AcrR family transcriptional regulator